ncbi:hypothetical protein [Candidatus Lucifugimonas marina]|uniref:C2H2-type domain-containing protein n=2 Tax=Candidatus Lucifugimonas marina TaxID=3038979 RepID=A0AAJ6CUE9_9CHLR|nr:hypothetical protein [SAR202 cluster bacterium JH702]MDG0870891.1 hypothetical protein [SAR202 cluster bacterium JH639]WFG34766.1 hypothetical protein GKN94_03415 [SAR202 cluster bacterium JH545]WFG38705.1 hypothetical protein GKO48_03490 [SAR202 cluster bacterium JH1073]
MTSDQLPDYLFKYESLQIWKFQCNLCNQRMKYADRLQGHLNRKHPGLSISLLPPNEPVGNSADPLEIGRQKFPKSWLGDECEACTSRVKAAFDQDHWDEDFSNIERSNHHTWCSACHMEKSRFVQKYGSVQGRAYFLDWVAEKRQSLGEKSFRELQDERNLKVELDRTGINQLQVEQSEKGLEFRFEVICNSQNSTHRYDLTAAQLGDSRLMCIVCSATTRLLAQKRMERVVYDGDPVWIELERQDFTSQQPNIGNILLLGAWLIGRLSVRRRW